MADEIKTRKSDKQRKEETLKATLEQMYQYNDEYNNDDFEAFWSKCKENGIEAQKVLLSLISLYGSDQIKLKKKKIVLETIELDNE